MLQRFEPHKGRFDVVIIGAGICGLTAALEITARSDKRVLILEAAETAGGRVKSIQLDSGLKVNAGAHWFHGGNDNPFFQWAKDRYDLGKLALDDVKGRQTVWDDMPDPENTLRHVFNSLDARYEKFARKHPDADISLHDLARKTYVEGAEAAAEFMATEWMAMDSAHDISCNEYFNDPLGPGGWQMKDGVDRLIQQMVRDARRRGVQVRCSQPVRNVQEWNDNVIVTLKSGEMITADQCLVTVSTGVLKEKSISFDTRVHEETRAKTKGIAMGNLAKVIIPMKQEFFEERGIESDARIYMIQKGVFVHARAAGEPVITLFRGGSPSHKIEGWGEKKLEKMADKVLSRVGGYEDYGRYRDGKITATAWQSDPFIRGSYSICRPHFQRSDPFACGRIAFAGEAFVADPAESPGQMPAAWKSAQKAADRLIALDVQPPNLR